ncbi:MAG: hypothetical protein ACW99U_18145 [Candidatus Thorarchaeota archaeon]|jgi:hypothetical protein
MFKLDTPLPDISLGEMFSLLGEKDCRIYQLEKQLSLMEQAAKPEILTKKDPFKKDK